MGLRDELYAEEAGQGITVPNDIFDSLQDQYGGSKGNTLVVPDAIFDAIPDAPPKPSFAAPVADPYDTSTLGSMLTTGMMEAIPGTINAIRGIPDSLVNTAKGAFNLVGELGSRGADPFMTAAMEAADPANANVRPQTPIMDALSQQTLPQDAAMAFSILKGNTIPGALMSSAVQQGANLIDSWRGLRPPQTGDEMAKGFMDQATALGAPALAAKANRNLLPTKFQAQNIGRNEYKLFTQLGPRRGIFGNILDVPSGTTDRKVVDLFETIPHEEALLENGVFRGLDTTGKNKDKAFGQFRERLQNLVDDGMRVKTNIIDHAQANGAMVNLFDVDMKDIQKLIKDDLTSPFTSDDMGALVQTYDQLRNTFLTNTGMTVPGTNQPLMALNPRTPNEVWKTIQGIDKKIEELGAFDHGELAKNIQDESTFANMRNRLESLRAARGALSDALVDAVKKSVGPDFAAEMIQANKNIQAGIEFGTLAKVFEGRTGAAFTPGMDRSMTSAPNVRVSSRLGGIISGITPGQRWDPMWRGLEREPEAIRASQIAAMARGYPGQIPSNSIIPPYFVSGVVDRVVEGAQSMPQVYNAIALNYLVDAGVIQPEQAHQGVNLNQVDPMAREQAGVAAAQVMKPVQDAQEFGSEDDVKAAFSNITRQFPSAFSPSKTGIPGEIMWDGKPMLVDPPSRLMYGKRVQESDMDENEKTRVLSELYKSGRVLKVVR